MGGVPLTIPVGPYTVTLSGATPPDKTAVAGAAELWARPKGHRTVQSTHRARRSDIETEGGLVHGNRWSRRLADGRRIRASARSGLSGGSGPGEDRPEA